MQKITSNASAFNAKHKYFLPEDSLHSFQRINVVPIVKINSVPITILKNEKFRKFPIKDFSILSYFLFSLLYYTFNKKNINLITRYYFMLNRFLSDFYTYLPIPTAIIQYSFLNSFASSNIRMIKSNLCQINVIGD